MVQLETTEKSVFCQPKLMKGALPNFKKFIVRFLIKMSEDFATRSIQISDQTHGEDFSKPEIDHRRQ